MALQYAAGEKRGRPSVNTDDMVGSVRVTCVLAGYEGNITRTLTFTNTKVSTVFKAVQNLGEAAPAKEKSPKTKKKSAKAA